MLNKKSQMEIMGLAIVILLLIIGMLFVVRFMFREPAEFKAEFTQTQLASNTLNAFLKSNTSYCSGMSITGLLEDCGNHIGSGGYITCDNGKLSCEYVNDTAGYIFSQTLDKWNLKYQFLVYFQNEEDTIMTLGEECTGDKKSETFYTPTGVRTLYTKLDICG